MSDSAIKQFFSLSEVKKLAIP